MKLTLTIFTKHAVITSFFNILVSWCCWCHRDHRPCWFVLGTDPVGDIAAASNARKLTDHLVARTDCPGIGSAAG